MSSRLLHTNIDQLSSEYGLKTQATAWPVCDAERWMNHDQEQIEREAPVASAESGIRLRLILEWLMLSEAQLRYLHLPRRSRSSFEGSHSSLLRPV